MTAVTRSAGAAGGSISATLVAAAALVVVSCSGTPAAATATPPNTAAPTGNAARTAPAPTAPDVGEGPAARGTATVEIAGQSFQLSTGETPVCAFIVGGAQLGLASSDAQTTLSVNVGPSGAGSFLLTTHLDAGELWAPIEAVPFEVDGDRATWTGEMRDSHSDREELVTIRVDCDG